MKSFKNFGFGRRAAIDTRDGRFLLMPDLVEAAKRTFRYWFVGYDVLNQGSKPHCVGYASYKWLTSGPVRNLALPFGPSGLYKKAQKFDEWPGENYDGTSVRGAFKFLHKAEYITEYRWAFTLGAVIAHLLTTGPIVVGTNWTSGMMTPDNKGFIKPTGQIVGGHAYLLFGVNTKKRVFRMINSWGADWGQNGRAWIGFDEFGILLEARGEACNATEIKKDKIKAALDKL